MKKAISMMLIFIMVLSMAACGSKKVPEEAGAYRLVEMTSGDMVMDVELFDLYAAEMGEDLRDMFILELKKDGTAYISIEGEEYNGKYGDGKISTPDGEASYTYADGKLTLDIDSDQLVFEKQASK